MNGAISRLSSFTKKHLNSRTLIALIFALSILLQTAYCFAKCGSRRIILVGGILLVFCIGLYVLYSAAKFRSVFNMERLFLVMTVFLGLVFLITFSPGTIPDETYHYLESYSLANSLLLIPQSNGEIQMRACDVTFFNNGETYCTSLNAATAGALIENFSLLSDDSSLLAQESPFAFDFGSNPPQQRLIPAIGILLGRLLNLGAIPTYYLGRLFNLLFFAIIFYFSAKIIPIGKKCIMAIALLPMSLHLAASYSYDVFILGMSVLLTSIICRGIFQDQLMDARSIACACAVAFLLAPCKVIYIILVLLVLLIPRERFRSKKNEAFCKLSIAFSAITGILFFKIGALTSMLGLSEAQSGLGVYAYSLFGEGVDYRGWGENAETGQFYTLADILRNPAGTIAIFGNTLEEYGTDYIHTTWGGYVGLLQIGSPYFFSIPFLAILFASCIRSKDDDCIIDGKFRLFFFAIFAFGVVLVMLAMMLGWTFNTEETIHGVQGRYFLPFLLPLFLSSRLRHLFCNLNTNFWCPYALVVANSIYLLWITAEIVLV